MNVKYDRKDIINRLKALDSKTLRFYSKISSQINYQANTKTALIREVRQLPRGTYIEQYQLKHINELLETYESIANEGEYGLVNNIYNSGSEEIQMFIRVQRARGWSEVEILVAVESNYDAIQHMNYENMVQMGAPSDDEVLDYYGVN